MNLSAFAAFLAGLVSFLSPCVLPLVPGYISMLSGLGVEELRAGRTPRGQLLLSALAFVLGFSIVFITFGASASAVGSFLLRNRTLLAPVAGALILLFGLHLVGALSRISIRVGLLIGVLLVAASAVLFFVRGGSPAWKLLPIQVLAISLIFFAGPTLSRWLNRDLHFRNLGGKPGVAQRFSDGIRVCLWLDALHRPYSRRRSHPCGDERIHRQGIFLLSLYSAGLAIPFLITALAISSFLVLPALSAARARRGDIQRSAFPLYGRTDIFQSAYLALRKTGLSKSFCVVTEFK